jgi:hypothetical protein
VQWVCMTRSTLARVLDASLPALTACAMGCGNAGTGGFTGPEAGGAPGPPTSSTDGGTSSVDPVDAGTFRREGDATAPTDGAGACSYGSASSIATAQNLNLFGQVIYYEDGGVFPPGRYRAVYTDGCMKYDSLQDWTVQPGDGGGLVPIDPALGFWLVGRTSANLIVKPPGTAGLSASQGAYATFDECVAGNLALDAPVEFDFDGGPIGVWLDDNLYSDNQAGDNGRNPAWKLLLLEKCPTGMGTNVPQ